MDGKGKQILNQMNTAHVKKKQYFQQAIAKFKVLRGENACSKDVKEIMVCLLSYFDKKDDVMFCYVDFNRKGLFALMI